MRHSREVSVSLVALAATGVSAAAEFSLWTTVTRTDDPTPNGCEPDDCSLREAIVDANAFPGAREARPGRVELADQGTLYLDEAAAFPQVLFDQLLSRL